MSKQYMTEYLISSKRKIARSKHNNRQALADCGGDKEEDESDEHVEVIDQQSTPKQKIPRKHPHSTSTKKRPLDWMEREYEY